MATRDSFIAELIAALEVIPMNELASLTGKQIYRKLCFDFPQVTDQDIITLAKYLDTLSVDEMILEGIVLNEIFLHNLLYISMHATSEAYEVSLCNLLAIVYINIPMKAMHTNVSKVAVIITSSQSYNESTTIHAFAKLVCTSLASYYIKSYKDIAFGNLFLGNLIALLQALSPFSEISNTFTDENSLLSKLKLNENASISFEVWTYLLYLYRDIINLHTQYIGTSLLQVCASLNIEVLITGSTQIASKHYLWLSFLSSSSASFTIQFNTQSSHLNILKKYMYDHLDGIITIIEHILINANYASIESTINALIDITFFIISVDKYDRIHDTITSSTVFNRVITSRLVIIIIDFIFGGKSSAVSTLCSVRYIYS